MLPAAASATLQTDPQALTRTMESRLWRAAQQRLALRGRCVLFSTVLDAAEPTSWCGADDPDNATLEG